jgi:hypothetical protein
MKTTGDTGEHKGSRVLRIFSVFLWALLWSLIFSPQKKKGANSAPNS